MPTFSVVMGSLLSPAALRLRRYHLRLRHDEPDSMAALRVHHENLPVEVEKHIEGRVVRLWQGM